MTPTGYFERRTAERGVTMAHVAAALAHEVAREVQPDGRTRIWGWVDALDQCLRVVVDADGETLVNAFPDRKCTRTHLSPPPP